MPPNTTVASFDIGIRHLAYCVLTQDHGCTDVAKAYEIIEWDVVDLLYVSGTIYEDICVRETAKEWRVDKLRQWLAEHQLDAEGKRSQLIDRVCKHLQNPSRHHSNIPSLTGAGSQDCAGNSKQASQNAKLIRKSNATP